MPLDMDFTTTDEWENWMDPCSSGLDDAIKIEMGPPHSNDDFLQTLWEPRDLKQHAVSKNPLSTTNTNTGSTTTPLSRKRKSNTKPNAVSCDAKLQALERQLQNLDPTSKEAKKQRRLIRNRMSAQLHRERKKAYVDQLEGELQARQDEILHLQAQVASLQQQQQSSTCSSSLPNSPATVDEEAHEDFFQPFSDGFLDPALWLEPPTGEAALLPQSVTSKVARWITVVLSMAFFSNNFTWLEQILQDPSRTDTHISALAPIQCTEATEWYGVADQVQVLAQDPTTTTTTSTTTTLEDPCKAETWTADHVHHLLQDPLLRQSLQEQARLTSTLSTMPASHSLLQFSWPLPSDRIVTFRTSRRDVLSP